MPNDVSLELVAEARRVCSEAFTDGSHGESDDTLLGPHPESCPCCAIVRRAMHEHAQREVARERERIERELSSVLQGPATDDFIATVLRIVRGEGGER